MQRIPRLHDRGADRIVEHFLKNLTAFREVFNFKQFYILYFGSKFKQQQYQVYSS